MEHALNPTLITSQGMKTQMSQGWTRNAENGKWRLEACPSGQGRLVLSRFNANRFIRYLPDFTRLRSISSSQRFPYTTFAGSEAAIASYRWEPEIAGSSPAKMFHCWVPEIAGKVFGRRQGHASLKAMEAETVFFGPALADFEPIFD